MCLLTFRQQVLVKSIVEVKPKRPRISETTSCSGVAHSVDAGSPSTSSRDMGSKSISTTGSPREVPATDTTKTQGGLLGLAYESEDDSDAELEETPKQRNSTGTSKVAQGLLVRGSLDANRLESLNDHSRSDVKLGGISWQKLRFFPFFFLLWGDRCSSTYYFLGFHSVFWTEEIKRDLEVWLQPMVW